MADQEPTVSNTAADNSTVGIQAQQVHNSTVYMNVPGMSAEQKFQKGVNALKGGLPGRALDFIKDAIADGHDSAQVRFHWFLAMLSKRSFRELDRGEREELRAAQASLEKYSEDAWKQGIETICALLSRMGDVEADPEPELKALRALPSPQRVLIGDHLGMLLDGTVKDALWADMRDAAKHVQQENDRQDKVWAFFEPEPAEPRVREPEPRFVTAREKITIGVSSAAFLVALGYLGAAVLSSGSTLAILAFPLTGAALCVGLRNAVEWRFRAQRLRVKERELTGIPRVERPLEGSFSKGVDRRFEHYFHKYAPEADRDRTAWLSETAGVRRALRDEIIELYRGRAKLGEVTWLIRRLVRDVQDRWREGTLWDHREHYRTSTSTRVWSCGGLLAAVAGVVTVVEAAVSARPVIAVLSSAMALVAGWIATRRWLAIILARLRFADDSAEGKREFDKRREWHRKWTDKVHEAMPTDEEMERWLNADKTVFLDEALREYQLAWRDIIAYTFLQSPARFYRRARVSYGPWRYSRYKIRLFLITVEGVREVSAELDFKKAEFKDHERTNYRFDAVASVHVTTRSGLPHTLELTLVNGDPRKMQVVDEEPGLLAPKDMVQEKPEDMAELTLESFGFGNTLHVLEGIAAEGKQWIHRAE
ncbi:hypothetical protein [Saccharomonospora cyanea]|uniref:Uncharacterized protein n=1 Tax=Saccharomonospora cyanea NA-134 TaxID=882082 RepID=H5XR73_9PSEU|nr:hypothetical protein [Saccharomonospora cyanea]EHR62314.1 hypothetical protein SaccyDRAFT_3485 [Saccharomonospora cyanea NA-134]